MYKYNGVLVNVCLFVLRVGAKEFSTIRSLFSGIGVLPNVIVDIEQNKDIFIRA